MRHFGKSKVQDLALGIFFEMELTEVMILRDIDNKCSFFNYLSPFALGYVFLHGSRRLRL